MSSLATYCLFTFQTSEYHQNRMLIDKYMYLSFYYLLTYCLWSEGMFG